MAKKTRTIPTMILNVKGDGAADAEALCNSEVFVSAVYVETINGIQDAISNNRKTAILFELGKSEYFVEINKSQWKQALEACIDRLVENEKYEECVNIKKLIDKIK
jgi:hypothetical protein